MFILITFLDYIHDLYQKGHAIKFSLTIAVASTFLMFLVYFIAMTLFIWPVLIPIIFLIIVGYISNDFIQWYIKKKKEKDIDK